MSNETNDTIPLGDLRIGDAFTVRCNLYTVTGTGKRYVETENEYGALVGYRNVDRVPRSSVRFKESKGLPNETRTNQEDETKGDEEHDPRDVRTRR